MTRKYYKYRSLADDSRKFTKDIFDRNQLYFAAPLEFNDPFESRYRQEWPGSHDDHVRWLTGFIMAEHRLPKTLARTVAEQELLQQSLESRFSDLDDVPVHSFRRKSLVLCLSRTWSSVLMWSHYSDSHRGICLEFEQRHGCPFWGRIRDVVYSDVAPVINMLAFGSRANWSQAKEDDLVRKTLLTKAKCWEYEQESRICLLFDEKRLHVFPKRSLSGVIFGCQTPPEHVELVRKWCGNRQRPVALKRVQLRKGRYQLELVNV